MDYMQLVKDTFASWWKHKYLWILGIISVLFAQSSNISQTINNNRDKSSNLETSYKNVDFAQPLVIIALIVIFILSILLSILAIYLKLRSNSALIQSGERINKGETLSFKESWALGNKYKTNLLLSSLLLNLPVTILVLILIGIIIAGVLLSVATTPIILTLVCGLGGLIFIVLFALAIFCGVLVQIADRLIVLENMGVIEAVKESYKILKSNFKHYALTWLVNLAVSIVTSIVISPFTFVLFLFLAPVLILLQTNLILGIVVFLGVEFIINCFSSLIAGPVATYYNLFWTNAYLRIKALSK